jgi:ABC-type molybdate transport system substrate-binding protein
MSANRAIPTDPKIYAKATEMVKARVSRWPSAYASGQLVIMYKKLMKEAHKQPYKNDVNKKTGKYKCPMNLKN